MALVIKHHPKHFGFMINKLFTRGKLLPQNASTQYSNSISSFQSGKMQAWQIYQYGDIGELTLNKTNRIGTIESPNEVLVKVQAASVNPIDVRMMGGYGQSLINLIRKQRGIIKVGTEFPLTLGRDFSGTVVQIGKNVNQFKVGDEVWGAIAAERQGTHAEYVVCSKHEISHKPSTVSHVEAASIPYVAATCWSAVCTFGQLRPKDIPNKRILIIGGSGGTGTFCIQMLKSWGADVTVTCQPDANELVTRLGANTAVDYTVQDVWQSLQQLPKFDFILDTVGGESLNKGLSLLSPWTGSKLVTLTPPLLANFDKYGIVPGLVNNIICAGLQTLKGAKTGKSVRWAVFRPDGNVMRKIAHMVDRQKIVPVIQETFNFSQVPEAFQLVSDGHLRGKVVIHMEKDGL